MRFVIIGTLFVAFAGFGLAQDIQSLVPLKASLVRIVAKDSAGRAFSQGSGFIVRDNGLIVTAFHVIQGAYTAEVRADSGDIYDHVDVMGYDIRKDLAY